MFQYAVKRILYSLLIMAGVLIVTFVLFRVAAGDPAATVLGKNPAAEELENLSAIINAEKEFAYRLEQLEIRYYRLYGRYSDNVGQPAVKSQENGENLTMVQRPSSFKHALPLAAAVLLAALIIATAMAMIFL